MFELMLQCDKLDPGRIRKLSAGGVGGSAFENTEDSNDVPTTPNTLMSGILPGILVFADFIFFKYICIDIINYFRDIYPY